MKFAMKIICLVYDKFMHENQDRVMKEVKLAKAAAQRKKE